MRGVKCVLAAWWVCLLLAPSHLFGITLREYSQARSDPARQSALFKDAYDATLARTLSSLRSPTFPDGKTKIPARIQRDAERAQRIQQFGPHLTNAQIDALTKLIDQYAAAQPDTQLEAVITSFLLTESDRPAEGFNRSFKEYDRASQSYEQHYQEFKAQMAALDDAINAAQVELNLEKLSLDDRRKQVAAPSTERIESMMRDFHTAPVIDEFIGSILSPTDSTGRPKDAGNVDVDTHRAAVVLEIGKHYDTDEVALRIYAAMKTANAVDLAGIFRGYVRDELARRGASGR